MKPHTSTTFWAVALLSVGGLAPLAGCDDPAPAFTRDVEIGDLLGRDEVDPLPHLLGRCGDDALPFNEHRFSVSDHAARWGYVSLASVAA